MEDYSLFRESGKAIVGWDLPRPKFTHIPSPIQNVSWYHKQPVFGSTKRLDGIYRRKV